VVAEKEARRKANARLIGRVWYGQMHRPVLWAVMVAGTCSVGIGQDGTTRQVTVSQLEQFLAAQKAAHTSDRAVAQQLSAVELNEALTDITLDRLKSTYKPGEQTATELDVLADLSAFLDPPDVETHGKNPAAPADEKQILSRATTFAIVTLEHLPDFLSLRTTKSFEDVPVFTADSNFQSGMHATGTSLREVAFRNGREFASDVASPAAEMPANAVQKELSSAGEFGPVLATIMSDSAQGKIAWSRWENVRSGLLAVFHYEVPKEAAHYEISLCCAWNVAKEAFESYDGKPAYHGNIWVDPASGAILRVTLVADFENLADPPRFGLLVRYGKVEIEGSSLICPLSSAVVVRARQAAHHHTWDVVHMNYTTFTGFRRFGSDAHIVSNAEAR